MGKRVSIQRAKVPQLNYTKLKQSADSQVLLFAFVLPAMLWFFVVVAAFFIAPTNKVGLWMGVLLGWPVVAYLLVKTVAGQHRSVLASRHKRSKVAGTAYPEIRGELVSLCRLLNIKPVPDAWIVESDRAAAEVRGMAAPYLMVSTRMLSLLSEEEQRALFAVLLGHIKAGTVKWRTMIQTALSMNPILKLLALPVVVVAWLGRDYRVDSQTAGDRIALLALRGEQIPLLRALVKQVGYEAGNLDEMTIGNVLDFIGKRGMEANATDFQSNYVLNQMLRNIPGLMDRWQNIVSSPSNANFAEQLDILLTREEMLERTSGR